MNKKEQFLVNAQIEINRCVFEMNRQAERLALPATNLSIAGTQYLLRHLNDAMADLQRAKELYEAEMVPPAAKNDSLNEQKLDGEFLTLPPALRSGNDVSDPLYQSAVEEVIKLGMATICSLQRTMRIGYNRAARLIEAMETAGVVGKMDKEGHRVLLVKQYSPPCPKCTMGGGPCYCPRDNDLGAQL